MKKRNQLLVLIIVFLPTVVLWLGWGAPSYWYIYQKKVEAKKEEPFELPVFDIHQAPPACAREADYLPSIPEASLPLQRRAQFLYGIVADFERSRAENQEVFEKASKAAEMGNWASWMLLAELYRDGLGLIPQNAYLEGDFYKTVAMWREGARRGYPLAFYNLGWLYERGGGGIIQDVQKAYSYYLKAARMGNPQALMVLAEKYGREMGRHPKGSAEKTIC